MSRGSILVVEKDSFYASFYEKLLSREGYRPTVASSVADGLRLFGERRWEVVISDMVVGGEDGLALLEGIKAADPRQDVVMITSMQSLRKAVEALKRGAADYLTKPVDGEELLHLLRTLIDRQTMRSERDRLVGENLVFYEQLRVQQRALELLAMLDIDRLVDHFLDLVIAETGAAWASLHFLREEDGAFTFAARRGIHDPRLEPPAVSFRTEELAAQLRQGRAVLEDRDGGQHAEGKAAEASRFLMPLVVAGRPIALVVAGPRRDERPHGPTQVAVARVLAGSAAIALRNARAFAFESARDLFEPATGTYSPAYFHQAGEKEVNVAHRYGRHVSLVCVQLDNFAAVKAALKETQARRLLADFAGGLLEVARETDVVAMLEEGLFGIVVPETDYYGALMLIKRLRAALRGEVFSLDLARELRPVVSMGAASYPRDGEQLVTILRRARERLVLDRGSLVRRLGLEGRSFWSAAGFLLGLDAGDPLATAGGGVVSLSTGEVERIRNLFLEEAARLRTSRGLLYIGAQTVDQGSFAFTGFPRLAGSRISIFALGARGPGGWNHPEVAPVFLADEQVSAHRFLFCITEDCYYASVCRPDGPDRWRVFHSADPSLALELVAKLQERYQLQQRVG